uniref:Protein arginine N-methyltransferase 5 n=2 Tax=Pygocentrus nattereri TaxID=42514 RepID=A0AAR2K2G9_PYGNA
MSAVSLYTGSRVSCGRDISCVPEVADTLAAVAKHGFDFLCMPLFHPRFRREFELDPAKARPGAQTRSDLLLCGRDWNTLIVGKLSPWIETDSELTTERRNSEAALVQELNFCAYLGLPAFMIPLKGPQCANLARVLLNHIHTGHHSSMFWIRVPLLAPEDTREDLIENEPSNQIDDSNNEEKTWGWWHSFRTLCDYNKRICLAIEIGADIPSDTVIDKWLGEPIKAAILPTSIFLTNKKGFPVLSKAHQRIIFRLFKLEAQFIFTGTNRHSEKDFRSYLQYLEYLNQNRPAPNAYELFAKGYEDYLQSPLQPLMDNLESQTYEVFEKDPIKYSQYQQIIYIADRKLRVYAVEKNPNAVITLENWKFEEWGDQVTVVSCDMRDWAAPEKADIIVSELLGSFGDNELSPECLDGAQHFLKDDGVSIPCSYTSFLAPLSSSKLYNEVRSCRERDKDPECHFETPYVVRLHNFHQLADPKPCFTFVLYTNTLWKQQFKCLFCVSGIRPETHSPGMFSWFPILFPLKQPIPLSGSDDVSVRFWRCNNGKKVWYEWAVTEPVCSAIHNPAGRSYTIGL